MKIATLFSNVRHFGVARAFVDAGLRAANTIAVVKMIKAIRIETADPAFLECDSAYRGMFLDEQTLREFAKNPANELDGDFLDEAIAKGDECYGFLHGDDLAAYGWYSSKPTDYDLLGLRLEFSGEYVYMYKGFTAAAHRGKRLHAIGMTRALQSYVSRGYRGVISCVDWNNFASRRSCYRMGYADFGNVVVAGRRRPYLLVHDRGCARYGFQLTRGAAGAGR